ncbi:Acetyl-CoA acetyltransferase, mitochondrial [Orchesella cincta]|uniref:Acetyl-CoA acetyltransferase, mitochondrial n=1 Tax=Orchesella cincta TaxID=48709 RepID=A0A1D2NBA4_ORCCI|nr:Acetyl-CoA acetyltransferase, mitochondrial [Orchesella cincta]
MELFANNILFVLSLAPWSRNFSVSSKRNSDVLILSAVRTPIGSFRSTLSGLSATQLGAVAIKEAVSRSGYAPDQIQEVYMGNVCQGGNGQAPARQALIFAGLPKTTECTTINKVCASGMKSIMLATQNLKCGDQQIMVAGGMESMSNVPYYMTRGETPYGGVKLVDGIVFDGLTDVYNKIHMGNCAENTAKKLSITREQQDEYGINSYKRTADAQSKGIFKSQTVPPLARVVGFADAATDPIDFPIAPALAVPKLLQKCGIKKEDVAMWEINEAFSVVVLANIKMLDIDPSKVNIHGGAVSLGHPIGMSGARILLDDVQLYPTQDQIFVSIMEGYKLIGILKLIMKMGICPKRLPLFCLNFTVTLRKRNFSHSIPLLYSTSAPAPKVQVERKKEVLIMSAVRTPVGSFCGTLSPLRAPRLGAIVIKEALSRSGFSPEHVQEVIFGHVLQAGIGQFPVRQAVLYADLPVTTDCTAVNKLGSSGIKSIMLAAQNLKCRQNDIMIAGGMESTSNVPYYLKREFTPYGSVKLDDGILKDGLTDVYNNIHMGLCCEKQSENMGISRARQDEYGMMSYKRRTEGAAKGAFKNEIVCVNVPQKGRRLETKLGEDEEYKQIEFDTFKTMKPIYLKEGTITAANGSNVGDGAAAVVVCNEEGAKKSSKKPLARIIDYVDKGIDPIDHSIGPAFAIPLLLKKSGMKKEDIALWEINEPFSVVALANIKMLQLDPDKVNVHGGAICIGQALGMAGTRLVVHLVHSLNPGEYGIACSDNGGGGFQIILNKWPLLALLQLPKRCKSRSISKTEDVFERKINEEVLVMSAVRTPIGSFCKSLSSFSAPQLCAFAIKAKPARQATIFGGLPADTVDCTTINKLEASGMKSIMLATLNLKCGDQQLMVAGGMESMSNIGFYLNRGYPRYGGVKLADGIIHDCQIIAHNQVHIGSCAERLAKKMKITREQQDEYALNSYKKRAQADENGVFKAEMVPVKISQGKGKKDLDFLVDEEYKNIDLKNLPKLPTIFKDDGGTITCGNSSSFNDGAAAVVLATESAAKTVKTKPLARIVGFQDAATDPMEFCLATVHAIPKLLEKHGMKKEDVALWEIHEGFSLMAIVNKQLLDLDPAKINVHGGAVALGHPIGMTGTRWCHRVTPSNRRDAGSCNNM